MEKSKKSRTRDRLSELPDTLIFEIFWQLPVREAVKTSLLSPRWKNLWTTSPFLNFEEDFINIRRAREFIARARTLWRGTKILKFKIDFGIHSNCSLFTDIDLLVAFAAANGVEELVVSDVTEVYFVPQWLYSCSSIKTLYLKGCDVRVVRGNVSWDQLECLTIDGYGLSKDSIDKVLSGSPKLETLKLRFIENCEDLSIRSSSLTSLYVHKYLCCDKNCPDQATKLRISTPNLKSLQLVEVPYGKVFMSDMPLLSYAKLFFNVPPYYWGRIMFYWNNLVVEALSQVLPAIQHVRRLVLSDWCIKVLGDMVDKSMVSPFPNVKTLKLYGRFEEHEKIVNLLEIFPELKKLVLRNTTARKVYYRDYARGSIMFETSFPSSILQELRSIVITSAEGKDSSVFPLIEILLKYANKLEKMVCRFNETAEPSDCLLSQQVMRMPRSSPNVEFTFL